MSSWMERAGLPDGSTTKAVCPECAGNVKRRHFLRAAEPEGDLIECSRNEDHWWVRGLARRQDETGTTEEESG